MQAPSCPREHPRPRAHRQCSRISSPATTERPTTSNRSWWSSSSRRRPELSSEAQTRPAGKVLRSPPPSREVEAVQEQPCTAMAQVVPTCTPPITARASRPPRVVVTPTMSLQAAPSNLRVNKIKDNLHTKRPVTSGTIKRKMAGWGRPTPASRTRASTLDRKERA